MKDKQILVTIALLFIYLLSTQSILAIEVEGEVSGIWTIDDSPVSVVDTIFIPADDTLTIEQGVVVDFSGPYAMLVHGKLFAEGTEDDSIEFQPGEDVDFWCGIQADSGAVVTLEYCIVRDCSVGDEDTELSGGALNFEGNELVLSNCIFNDNRCSRFGGAVYTEGGSVLIINCVFRENIADYGGAIFSGSLTIISDNSFTSNSAGAGGAIFINKDAIISDNSFTSNSAGAGGAICTGQDLREECIISGNTFIENHASEGGALLIGHLCSVVVHHNIISRNNASFMGGGIELTGHGSLMQFYSNIITFNEGGEWGGGISVAGNYSIRPINCIIRGNSAENGDQISFNARTSDVFLSYCNIEGGWIDSLSDHVIDEDPLFVDPDNDDYHLTQDSPCIDAGDPESDLDPDSTIADIGAFFFPQQNIAVDPDTLEFINIQTGLSDSVAVTIHNIGLDTLEIDSLFITQEGDIFSIGLGDGEFFLEPDSTRMVWIVFSPVVQAQYEAILTIASNDRDQSALEIPIIASALSVLDELIDIPEDFVLFEAYPNPFNSATTITFGLAKAAPTRLILYDISGREVRTLFEGYSQAGFHSVNLNAGDLSSGLYFVRLDAGSFSQSRKVVLIK